MFNASDYKLLKDQDFQGTSRMTVFSLIIHNKNVSFFFLPIHDTDFMEKNLEALLFPKIKLVCMCVCVCVCVHVCVFQGNHWKLYIGPNKKSKIFPI